MAVTKTVRRSKPPESRHLVRADGKRPRYLSLPSREPERVLGLYVSRVKGDGLFGPKVAVIRKMSGTAGIEFISARLKFILGTSMFFWR